MEKDQTFEIIEAQTTKANPIPPLNRQRDGFTRNDVVNAFARAFDMIGGVQRMALWANANPDKFYPLYSKLLPSTAIQIGDNANVTIIHALPQTPLDQHNTFEQSGPATDDRQPEVQGRSGS